MKDEIQRRINTDTLQKIAVLSEKADNMRTKSQIQMHVQALFQSQLQSQLQALIFTNRGYWRSQGQIYLKSSNKGFCGLGIKALMKDRSYNGF